MRFNPKSIIYGTMVLTCANFLVRILGFVYRILLSRLIGPQGMGLIQMVNPVYMIAITFTVSGIPIAISKLVSEAKIKNDSLTARRIVNISLVLVVFISVLLSAVTLCNLDFISVNILKEARTRSILFIIFPCIVIVGLACVFKGFFYGLKDIHPPAFAEIIEQITRMSVALTLLYLIVPENYEVAGAIVAAGMVVGELASLLFLHYRYRNTFKNEPVENRRTKRQYSILRSILTIAAPITLTRLASTFMHATNAIIIPRRLIASGMTNNEAIGLFGIASGMVLPLLFLPFTITNALSVVIIPNLSEKMALKDWIDIREKISKTFLTTCATAFPAIALLASLGEPIGNLLYKQPLVGQLLKPMAFSMVFHALQHTSSGILNGLGKQNKGALHFITGSIIQLILTYTLVANPKYRINGFIISFFAGSVIVSTLNVVTILNYTGLRFQFANWIIKPGISALFAGLSTYIVHNIFINAGVWSILSLLFSAVISVFIYILSHFLLGGFPDRFIVKAAQHYHNLTEK